MKRNQDTRKPIRHGELLLLPVPDQDMSGSKERTDYIASHSETGHHHVIAGRSRVLERENRNPLIRLSADTRVEHRKTSDRHDPLPVQKGTWKVIRKKEYDPFQKVMRNVWD